MKKLFVLFVFAIFSTSIFAQVDFGIKAGLNTYDLDPSTIQGDSENFTLSIKEAQYGFHAGIFLRMKAGPISIQPEVLFNSDNVDFIFSEGGAVDKIVNEKYNHVDIPVMVGFKLGPIRINAGPVGHYFINSVSDLAKEETYDAFFEKFTVGWQAGGGFDLKQFTVDLRYEGNFSKFGDHIKINNQEIAFNQSKGRIVASVGYKF